MPFSDHWTIPTDHPAFAGHFPGAPIVPGVLLLDRAVMVIAEATGFTPDALTIRSVKFLSPVGPGETVVIEHHVAANGTIHLEILCDAPTGTRKVASGSIAPGGSHVGEVAD